MIERTGHFIDGQWVRSSGTGFAVVDDASTGEPFARVALADGNDLDRAIEAAHRARESWASTPLVERLPLLSAAAERLGADVQELATLISTEVGTPISVSPMIQVATALGVVHTTVGVAADALADREVAGSTLVKQPAGVAACITPWNYPLYLTLRKVAPALAAGCPVVVKPSEVAPLSLFRLAEAMHAVGLPDGVFNLVVGDSGIGRALVGDPRVDKISYTGSTAVGADIARSAATTMKRLTLELGGKSAAILLDDADLESAVDDVVRCCYLNAGQSCRSWTRLLVPRHLLGTVNDLAREAARSNTLGPALDPSTTLGPVATGGQRSRVLEMAARARGDGAREILGAADFVAPEAGHFVAPMVFTDVDNRSELAQQEVFGPLLAIIPFDDDDEAVSIANDSRYGLHGAVFSADLDRAERLARRLRTGQVDINAYRYNLLAPFGGFKQSGIGREFGAAGIDAYTETQSIQH